MAITYTWTVDSMSVLQTPDPDYVVIAEWTCAGTDGTNSAEIGGGSRFSSDQVGVFVPYADLTEEIVLGWINEDLGVNGISNTEANVEGQINSIINPPVSPTVEPLPWA
tara:strand:+ start:476 stop:802 length:327 start_codon:yes stop_codon:yes gene_type:complete